jgi:hypothetical protein
LTPPPWIARVLLFISVFYFIWDSLVVLYVRAHDPQRFPGWWAHGFLAHHAVCAVALLVPAITGQDVNIALGGFVLGELSNPPRLMALLCHRYKSSGNYPSSSSSDGSDSDRSGGFVRPPSLQMLLLTGSRSQERLVAVHYALFIICRLAGVHFTAHFVLPFAELLVTKLGAGLTIGVLVVFCVDFFVFI